jgi:hypothetical protein
MQADELSKGAMGYRRGCEYLFGTNGYDCGGDELRKALGS